VGVENGQGDKLFKGFGIVVGEKYLKNGFADLARFLRDLVDYAYIPQPDHIREVEFPLEGDPDKDPASQRLRIAGAPEMKTLTAAI
jgi:hypothetical protein